MQSNKRGTDLAKVLYYYGMIPSADSDEQKIVCPFHNDMNPSMKVDLQEGSWFCFGCNMSGDAMGFVKEIEKRRHHLNDLQSCKKFYKVLKSEKTEAIRVGIRTKTKKDLSQRLIEAEDYYYNLKQDNWLKRPEDKEARDAILYMKNRGFTLKILNEIGCRYTYERNYPIVFPMLDNGKFMGWVKRTDKKAIEQKRKYMYNEGFSRRNTLCGSYENDGTPLYIVEGYMDMLKMKMFGVKNVVAILGWKMTNEQLLKLRAKGYKVIISALDNDTCGKKGTEYLRTYFKVVPFQYEDGIKDPGEMDQKKFDRMNRRTTNLYKKEKEHYARFIK